ncbi:sensor histidine kinase, partial [Bradyrhizobium manausense]|uniref:ATP-binding protein n=1 Tax=Bradyrhizobium manausense TaxID=989370 RepID=UPI001BAB3D6A
MTSRSVHFIAHARLKDLVGRGLINDDNVAIIELIKNGKDAGSNRVVIKFSEAVEESGESRLIIQDFGHGMTFDDIRYKWLNIAYSEKKGASRKNGEAFAGNKGIGRFSCDRLGRHLDLYTKTSGGSINCLEIDWTKFEVDDRDRQIGTIKARVRDLTDREFTEKTGLSKFAHGTVLVIRSLRSRWSRKHLVDLRKELERFAIDPNGSFKISVGSSDFPNDEVVNGDVENKIFERLDFRTTSILASIPSSGREILVSLRHDGDEVFSLRERNPYAHLRDLKITIFYLNTAAKAFFKRQTGYRSVDFGSVFFFLNGFRVPPYGNESNDWLSLDQRKAQGQRRFLSTRDVVGYVEVADREGTFQPVSSREGLVHNAAFLELTSDEQNVKSSFDDEMLYGMFHKVFRKLERFVVEGLDWDRINEVATPVDEERLLASDKFEYATERRRVLDTLIPTIGVRTPRSHTIDVQVNLPYVLRLAQDATTSYEEFVQNLQEKFEGTSASNLSPTEKRDLSRFIKRQAKELAVKSESVQQLGQANTALQKAQAETKHQLAVEEKRRLFAEFESTADQARILQMHHQIGILSGKLFKAFDRAIRRYRADPNTFSKDQLFEMIERSMFDIDKIRKVSKFAAKASFDLSTNKVTEDLVQFVQEYIESFNELSLDWNIKVAFSNPKEASLVRSFRPIELSMLIDNLIDNAGKAGAKALDVVVAQRGSKLSLSFVDNGSGLPKMFKPEELFHSGITTTSGSGIGLKHAQKIVEDLEGRISIKDNEKQGATDLAPKFYPVLSSPRPLDLPGWAVG